MAITGTADLAGILYESRLVLEGITGIVGTYERAGEIPADDAALPAAVQTPSAVGLPEARIDYAPGQRVVWHYWYVDVLIDRVGDTYGEQTAALPFVDRVITAYETNISLGHPAYIARCLVQSFQIVTISAGDQAFTAVRFLIECKAKSRTTFADPG